MSSSRIQQARKPLSEAARTFFMTLSYAVALLFLLSNQSISQETGKIGKFKEEAKSEKKDSIAPARPATTSSTNRSSNSEPSFGEAIAMEVFEFFLKGIFYQFPGENEELYDNTFWSRSYTDFPYSNSDAGRFMPHSGKSFAFSFGGYVFTDTDRLSGAGGRLFASPHPVLNFEVEFLDLSEKLAMRTDKLRFYEFFVNYNRIKADRVSLWWGLGAKGMSGGGANSSGLGINAGLELFPFSPVSFLFNANVGFLPQKPLSELLLVMNYSVDRFEVKGGYQRFVTGEAVLDGLVLGAGVQL